MKLRLEIPLRKNVLNCVINGAFSHEGRRERQSVVQGKNRPDQSSQAGAHSRRPGNAGAEHRAAVGDRVMELLERQRDH